jgi:PAS domain S-box-containing protein
MTKDRKPPGGLRAQAERRVRSKHRKPSAAAPVEASPHIRHELEVHQAELEIQNEELRGARAETEAALARYTELFDFAPLGYATLSPDAVVRELNHAGARLLGRPRSQAVGTSFTAYVAPGDRPAFDALLRRAEGGHATARCELALELAGQPIAVRLTAAEVTRSGRTILLSFEDISEQLAREQQLARAEQALREASRRKDEFLGMLSHELRNPLGPISGSLFILDRVEPGSRQAIDARAIIDRQVTHLARLIDDLLDVTRIARGKIELQRESVELVELVRRTIDDHRAAFEARGIRVEARLDGGPLWLDADPARLVQIASNLLGNAEKFTPADGTVRVSVERHGGRVALRVRDTGAGIAPELLPGVFEPFAQAPQTIDRSRGGLGLGLATVKGLAELHGGTVQISSEGPGCGTEAVVWLPLVDAPAPVARAGADAAGPSRRVLVIDDNDDFAEALGEALRLMGHDVRVADRGAAGLDLARTFRPETVVCDLGLPEMDGFAVAAAARGDAALRAAHLIALSGYARPEDQRRSAEAGFDHHVAKPPDLQRLGRLIAEGPQAGPSSPSQHREPTAAGRAAASS